MSMNIGLIIIKVGLLWAFASVGIAAILLLAMGAMNRRRATRDLRRSFSGKARCPDSYQLSRHATHGRSRMRRRHDRKTVGSGSR